MYICSYVIVNIVMAIVTCHAMGSVIMASLIMPFFYIKSITANVTEPIFSYKLTTSF